MSQSHQSGAQRGSRVAGEPVIHTIPITFANYTAAQNYKVITFKVKANTPLLIRSNIIVMTAGDGTTQTLTVGTAAAGAQIHAASSINAVQNTNYSMIAPSGAGLWQIYKSTDAAVVNGVLSIWVVRNQTGSPTDVGRAILIIEAVEVNLKKLTGSGAV